jgi:hypothetical protein
MPKPERLPESWQGRMDAMWDELVDLDFYSRFDGEIQRDSQVLAEQWADDQLTQVGRQRLTSDLFWSLYAIAADEGLEAPAALRYAIRATPELQ